MIGLLVIALWAAFAVAWLLLGPAPYATRKFNRDAGRPGRWWPLVWISKP